MSHINITFPDGKVREYPQGVTGQEIAESISPQFAKKIFAAKYNNVQKELRHPIMQDAKIELLDFSSDYGKDVYWHSSAHIMAQAIKRHYPSAELGFGPNIEEGFFYDIKYDKHLTEDDFKIIEDEIAKIVKEALPITRYEWSKEEAVAYFTKQNEKLKAEHIQDIDTRGETISVYTQGDFTDLCAGPHLPNTNKLSKFVKLLSVSGAYWKGREDLPMLQRIYAVTFPSKELLDEYIFRIEESKKRDHRKLGKELKLFSFHSEFAAASPFFLPKGAILYNQLLNLMRQLYVKYDYKEVITPQILDSQLWHTSGHYENYKDNMYFTTIEDREFAVKPMNCPTHALIFSEDSHSYRDLPLRIADFGRLHRYEKSGATHGLTRVRTFCQDDAHIFVTESQIKKEVTNVINMIFEVYNTFRFTDIIIGFSTRPDQSIGSDEIWNKAETALKEILDESGKPYIINEKDGAFYGPKIDFQVKDALHRAWQLGTIQLDFNLPNRFELKYRSEEGKDERPVMIHRALLGSLERFIGIMIEHFAGNFPLWLAPTQIIFLPIGDRHFDKAHNLLKLMQENGLRAEVDERREKIGYKIREAELLKVPYMIVIGDAELNEDVLSVRHKQSGDLGKMSVLDLINKMTNEVKNRTIID
jgi:threonyl-tRNA synthetase